jgi:hypothetical protein
MPIAKITAVEIKPFTIFLCLPDKCSCTRTVSFFKNFLEKIENKTVFEHSNFPVLAGSCDADGRKKNTQKSTGVETRR